MKRLSLFILIGLSTSVVFSQKASNVTDLLSEAEYNYFNREYVIALGNYLQAYKQDSTHYNAAYKIGACYLEENMITKAIRFLQIAEKGMSFKYKEGSAKERNASYHTLYLLGKAYQSMHEYDKAIGKYTEFKNALEVKKIYEIDMVDRQIEACVRAKKLTNRPVPVEIFNLGIGVNTGENEMFQCVSNNDSVMVFARRMVKQTTSFGNKISVTTYSLFHAIPYGDTWKVSREITSDIRSDGFFIPVSLSPDGKKLVLYRDNYNHGQMNDYDMGALYVSEFKTGRWTSAKKMDKTINSVSWEYSGSFNNDNTAFVFSSDRKGGSGGLDLYISRLVGGKWSNAENLGKAINTDFDEDFPVLIGDSIIIFSSEKHDNMGGYDMFLSKKVNGTWSVPINLGFPINTPGDDERIAVSKGGKKYYFSSLRPDGYLTFGQSDIYEISVLPEDTYEPIVVGPSYNREKKPVAKNVEPQADSVIAEQLPVPVEEESALVETPEREKPAIDTLATQTSKPIATEHNTEETAVEKQENDNTKKLIAEQSADAPKAIPVYESARNNKKEEPTEVVGTVVANNSEEKKININVSLIDAKTSKKVAETKTDSDGTYNLKAGSGDYKIVIEDEKIETKEHNLYIPSKAVSQIAVQSPVVNKGSLEGEYYRIRAVFFDYGKNELSREAQIELERLFVLMNKNTSLYVEVSGHTDSWSSASFNQKLSLRRAEVVVNYLVTKGIDPMRFVKKGCGETQNIAINENKDGSDNPEGRRYNRRVEIKVLNSTDKNIVVEDITVPEHLSNKHDLRYCVILEKKGEKQPQVTYNKYSPQGAGKVGMVKVGKEFWYHTEEVTSKPEAVRTLNKMISLGFDQAELMDNFSLRDIAKSKTVELDPDGGYYTIQLLATYSPRDIKKSFKGFYDVKEFYGKDGFYRYTTGSYASRLEAEKANASMDNGDFGNSYVINSHKLKKLEREDNNTLKKGRYTIQLFALSRPLPNPDQKLPGLIEKKGQDGMYRYIFGEYETWDQAEKGKQELASKGYDQTFIVSMVKFRQ